MKGALPLMGNALSPRGQRAPLAPLTPLLPSAPEASPGAGQVVDNGYLASRDDGGAADLSPEVSPLGSPISSPTNSPSRTAPDHLPDFDLARSSETDEKRTEKKEAAPRPGPL